MAKYVDSSSYKTDIIWLPWPHSSNVRFKYTSAHHIDNMLFFSNKKSNLERSEFGSSFLSVSFCGNIVGGYRTLWQNLNS